MTQRVQKNLKTSYYEHLSYIIFQNTFFGHPITYSQSNVSGTINTQHTINHSVRDEDKEVKVLWM